jgi:gas vesicle protein
MNKILVGFTAGLLVGLLFAPAKGSDTRENLSRKGRDLKDKFNDLVDSIVEKFETVSDDVAGLAEEASVQSRSYKNEVI